MDHPVLIFVCRATPLPHQHWLELLQGANGRRLGTLPHGLQVVLPVRDDLRLDDLLLLLLVQLGQPDAQQLGQDLLEAEVDALAGLGGGRVRQEAVVLGPIQ